MPPCQPAERNPSRLPLLSCVVSAVLFGASTPATKSLTTLLGPFQIAGLLYAGAALAVSPWALRPWLASWAAGSQQPRQRGYLLGALALGGVVGPVLLVVGLSLSRAGDVALWLNLETVATALLARMWFREHLHAPTWLAVALIVTASALLSLGQADAWLGALFVAGACLAWGFDNNFTSLIGEYTPAQVTFAKGVVGAGVNLALALLLDTEPLAPSPAAQALIVGGLGYGASLVLYVSGAQLLGATRSQLVFSTAPAWGLLLSWVAYGEPLAKTQLVAATLMAAAIWLWSRENHSHRHRHEPVVHTHWHRHDDGHHDGHHDTPRQRPLASARWHSHEHRHESVEHEHSHLPDLHHRHPH